MLFRCICIFFFIVSTAGAFSEEFAVLKRVDDLIQNKEYTKAYNVLDTIDTYPEFPVEYVYYYKGCAAYGNENYSKAADLFYVASKYNVLKQRSYQKIFLCSKKLKKKNEAFNLLLDKIQDIQFITENISGYEDHVRVGQLYKKVLKRASVKKVIDEYIKIYPPKTFYDYKYAGKKYLRARDYKKAEYWLQKANAHSPNWIRKEEVVMSLAESLYKQRKYAEAKKYYNILKRSKNYSYQMEAYNYLYVISSKQKNVSQKNKYEQLILESNPVLPLVARKHFQRGFDLFAAKEYKKAYGVFNRISKYCETATYKADAFFWCGHCMEKLGDHKKSSYFYEIVWKKYSQAQIREAAGLRNIVALLKQKKDTVSDMYLDSVMKSEKGTVAKLYLNECAGKKYPFFSSEDLSHFYVPDLTFSRNIDSKHFQLAIKFSQAGLKEIGYWEISEFVREKPVISRKYLASFVLNWIQEHRKSVLYAESIERSANKQQYTQSKFLAYPVIYYKYILKYAKKYNVDPYLVLSVIREESRYDASAVSRSGACGLMQIMPATGRWIARSHLKEQYSRKMLFDPETNIRFGTWYLSYLNKQFKTLQGTDKIVKILASYNGGIGNVRKWDKRFNVKNPVIFSELLEFPETRYYVKKVLRSYLRYHDIYVEKK